MPRIAPELAHVMAALRNGLLARHPFGGEPRRPRAMMFLRLGSTRSWSLLLASVDAGPYASLG